MPRSLLIQLRARLRFRIPSLTLVLALGSAGMAAAAEPPQRTALAHNGMVVSADPIASQVGLEVLEDGGNAVDAAIATAFALAVVYPRAGNLGGGGFFLYRDGATGNGWVVDFRETAPAASKPTMFLGPDGEVVPGLSTEGFLSVGVPGAVAGLELAHQRYGLLSWKRVVRPAYRLAKRGFTVSPALEKSLKDEGGALARNPGAAAIFFPGGQPLRGGMHLKQPDLARTLERISDLGAAGFYRGPTAEAIVADAKAHGGILDADDFASYRARVRRPIEGTFDNLKLLVLPPPSSGGVILLEILNMLEPFRMGRFPFGSASAVHLMAETERRAYADRAAYLGDPDYCFDPVTALTSKQYAMTRGADISMMAATPSASVQPGPVLSRAAPPEVRLALAARGGADTTHFAVVDRWRNAVAVSTSLNSAYGAKVVAAGTGVLLNDVMDDFAVKPGAPNQFGLVGSTANEIRPGKRPLSSMCPTIVLKYGKPYLVLGTPGGATIITSVLQVLLNVVEHGMTLPSAVGAPRVHHQWVPDQISMEAGALDPSVQAELQAMGHMLAVREPIGDFQAIRIDAARGVLEGVCDPRWAGEARGY
jgi:gamma-glutamyltranspeptidase/glutathione hydrolase